MKKKLLLLPLILLSSLSTACELFSVSDNIDVEVKKYVFYNQASDFTCKEGATITTYFVNDSEVPYIDVEQFMTAIKGVTLEKGISYNYRRNYLMMSFDYEGEKIPCAFDWKNNYIYLPFSSYPNYLINESQTTSYSSHIKYISSSNSDSSAIYFMLGDYGFDIYHYDGKCLLPFNIMNTVFCSSNQYNIYFNGDAYYGVWGYISNSSAIRSSSLNNKDISREFRESNLHFIDFLMDYFYGLKDYKNLADTFSSNLSDEIVNNLLSTNYDTYSNAYYDTFNKYLNDLHSGVLSDTFYAPTNYKGSNLLVNQSKRYKDYIAQMQQLNQLRDSELIKYYDNTATIRLDSFVTGTNEEISQSDGYLYDSYEYMRYCLSNIAQYETKYQKKINNIVLDLSLNGGGNLGALERVLGFITDENIPFAIYNSLGGLYSYEESAIDADNDDDYEDKDAYSQYNWYILTSSNTFSAANYCAAICKNSGFAKIIGQKSGGGMCSVLYTNLLDGTSLNISSNTSLRVVGDIADYDTYYEVESGIEPDIYIADFQNFYNDEYICNLINEVK